MNSTLQNKEYMFSMYRGDTRSWRLNLPYDVTGVRFVLTLKQHISDYNSMAPVSINVTAGDNPLDDPVNGIVWITIDSITSSKLSPSNYVIGLCKIVDDVPADVVTTLFVGTIEVKADVLHN